MVQEFSNTKLPPQDIDAEKSVLGALMLDKNAVVKVADLLLPEDFYKPRHLKIYQVILDIFERGEPIDFLSVSSRLKEKNFLEEVGGNSYLTELINFVPTSAHIASYAKIVQRKRVLRDLISASHEINELGYMEDQDIDEVLDKAEQKVFQVAQKNLIQNFTHIKEALGDAIERIDRLSKGQGALRGVATGFKGLDNLLSGLQKSDLIILAGRPSMGKSALALNFASNVALQEGVPVAVFSLEMSKDQVVDRFISSISNVDLWRIRTGKLSNEGAETDFERIQHAMSRLSETGIYINDAAITSVVQMRAMARRLQSQHGLGLIIVDYLQLIEPKNSMLAMVQQVTEISRSLKIMAKELNVPVLALSQLSRAVEQRIPPIPRLADLRESGSLEQDADVVILIYREDKYKNNSEEKDNITELIIAKHRNGPTGSVKVMFDEPRASFKAIAKEFQGEFSPV